MSDLSQYVLASAQAHNVDPALINAVIQQESGGNPAAQNPVGGGQGAWGPMQVRAPALADYNAANGTKYTVQDLLKPQIGVDVGSWYLGKQLDQFGDPSKALVAYNQGAASPAVARGTNPYAQSVLGRLQMPQQQTKTLPGIPTAPPQGQLSDDAIFSAFTKGAAPQPQAPQQGPSDDQILAAFTKSAPVNGVSPQPAQAVQGEQPGGVMSFLAGLGRGVQQTALGAQQLLGHGMEAIGLNTAGNWLVNDANQGLQRGAQEFSPYQQAHPIAAGAGKIGGSMAATAPLGAIGAGGVLGGVATGALGAAVATPVDPSNPDYWREKAQQTALGAVTGGIASPIIGALGRTISPNVSPDVQMLLDRGVTPTPGQILGGAAARTEDKLSSVPVLGDLIKNAQQRAVQQFNVAAYNEALAPIGQSFDSSLSSLGQEGISQVKSKIQNVYNSVLPNMQFRVDPQFQNEVTNLGQMASNLPASQQQTFMNVLKNQLFGKMTPQGYMDGQTLKGVSEELGDKAAGYLGDGSYDNRQLGAALSALKSSLMDGVKRSSPGDLAQQLNNADAAWANFARLRSAASSIGAANNEGIFTAAQLQNAVRAGDKSAGKGAFATGNALMQDFSGAGQRVLGSKYPDSGTAGRGLLALLAPGGVAAGLATAPGSTLATLGGIGLGSLPYTQLGQRAAAALLTARPQFAAPVGNAVGRLGPMVIPGGVSALLSNGGSAP